MKIKLIISALALASSAHATLIDLTPGGFNINQPWPQPVLQFFNHIGRNGFQCLAGANIDGGQVVWSPFTIFGSDNFGIVLQDPPNAQVSWNLTNTVGYLLQYVLLKALTELTTSTDSEGRVCSSRAADRSRLTG